MLNINTNLKVSQNKATPRMEFLPVFLNVTDKPCVIVGGGPVAANRYALLIQHHAKITVIAAELCTEFGRIIDSDQTHLIGDLNDSIITQALLVVAAGEDLQVNTTIAKLCSEFNVPVNVPGNKELSTFVFPTVVNRSPVKIAISTSGQSPILSRLTRIKLETLLPGNFGKLEKLIDEFRTKVKAVALTPKLRRLFWEKVLLSPVAELIYSNRSSEARSNLESMLCATKGDPSQSGEVYLVGAGPGDPDLLTSRALRLIKQAQVVVFDRLVSKPILDLLPHTTERIYVGKQRADHAVPQEGINALLVRLAKEGKRVLRLKGGDPFIFGRGGEEIETLIDEGIQFQVVPGITAASGCSSYSGIPLTHRDYSQACIFVTGHLKDGTVNLNWEMLTHPGTTVVFYMGLQGVDVICQELIAHHRSPCTPAALIQQGTTPDQKVLTGTLETLPELVRQNDIKAPTLIIVGEVVDLHQKLRWFTQSNDINHTSPKARNTVSRQ
jgi:uroporphyrin-III C-methyltransferase/precorrin-2 dehydrogenase/sirohydrochlorin ferrochelatase